MTDLTTLSSLGELIFLDRYALRDPERKDLQIGDTVVVIADRDTGQREVGEIVQLQGAKAMVALRGNDTTPSWFLKEYIDKPLETIPQQMISRVARVIAQNEKDMEYWYNQFVSIMQDWKFVPAGRILAGAGNKAELTWNNCFVLPNPQDSRQGIFERLSQMAEIMSRGGGVGINLSSLRPKRAYVKGVNGRSSGAVSWGSLFSTTTGLIEQGGSRRGALALVLDDWHPDIEEFINSKREAGKITNANISVTVSDDFMEAVKHDLQWNLVFPDTAHPNYDEEWNGNISDWRCMGYPVKVYKTIKAKDLWNQIISSAWSSAEPGIAFLDRSNKMSNSWYYDRLVALNPCHEEPLPANGVCLLGAINLGKFYHPRDKVDWGELANTIKVAVRFLDNVIDVTPYPFPENRIQQQKERRMGLGTMGLAELLVRNEIRYGSDESVEFIDELYGFIATAAYTASIELAAEKGSFPEFDASNFLDSGYMQNMPLAVRAGIRRHGIRNVTLLTAAPTGSTATMLGTSTSLEPYFSFRWTRKTRLGSHEEYMQVAQDWLNTHTGELPDYFVTAQELTPEEHVRVQSVIQRWVDAAISKTCNLPADYTVEQVGEIYQLAHELGAKGLTVYRDQSRSDQVLYDKPLCPECKSENYVKEAGCATCADCGYSKCDIVKSR